MASVPLPTATARMDQDAADARKFPERAEEASSKSRRCREKIGGSPCFVGISCYVFFGEGGGGGGGMGVHKQ